MLVNGIPQVTATPARAPVGGRVRLEGTGFTDAMWRVTEPAFWLAGGTGCSFYAQATHSITVSAAGPAHRRVHRPRLGGCRMSDIGERPVTSGTYRIMFTCTSCAVGELQVTTTAGPCVDVAFAPNSDSLASDIVATGMDCAEAEALVRRTRAQLGPVNGAARLEVDGFVCVRTAQSDRGLPSADYECTSGPKKVTFHRT